MREQQAKSSAKNLKAILIIKNCVAQASCPTICAFNKVDLCRICMSPNLHLLGFIILFIVCDLPCNNDIHHNL